MLSVPAMRFSHLIFFEAPVGTQADDTQARAGEREIDAVRDCLAAIPGLTRALIYTPARASDLFTDDPGAPCFGFQLCYDEIEALEAAALAGGGLHALATDGSLDGTRLAGATVRHQAMLTRHFPVAQPRPLPAVHCSYAVHYPGPAADENAWLDYYISSHPPIMARFPGILEIEILTRIDWRDHLPWQRVHHMQRNRVVFESPDALTAALHSPVRHEMRADLARFPAFAGGNFHYPFRTEVVMGTR
ncbi:hypothetical protein [Breoghania sp. JC706]|uniref:hypothetical protein n=1 Tax=Breoghania sp. JC706 TaxID=3117732 RepID=UPI0030091552